MSIKVIATDLNNGWFYIEKKNKIYLLRPPYTSSFQFSSSKYEVLNSIQKDNFSKCEIDFKDIDDAIRFVKKEYVKLKKTQGINIPTNEQLKGLLDYANDEILWGYLKSAKNKLIPDGKIKIAKSIATDFLKLEKVKNNYTMKKIALKILEKCLQCDNQDNISSNKSEKLKVIGIGGSGSNIIKEMVNHKINGLEIIALNTDLEALSLSQASQKVQIGKLTTRGLGAGGDPEIGKKAAEEDRNMISKVLEDAAIVFITTGMGGGTGSGAAPIVAEIAKREGALTIGVVTRPFSFEGKKRMIQAEQGIEELKKHVDTLIIVSNDRLLTIISNDTSVKEAFEVIDRILRQSVQAITDLIALPGLINIDLVEIRALMKDAGLASVGIGVGHGHNKGQIAAEAAISSLLLELSIKKANSLLVNVTGGLDMSLYEVEKIIDVISKTVEDKVDIVFGAIIDENMKNEIRVSFIVLLNKMMKIYEIKKNNNNSEKYDKELEIPKFLNTKIKSLIK